MNEQSDSSIDRAAVGEPVPAVPPTSRGSLRVRFALTAAALLAPLSLAAVVAALPGDEPMNGPMEGVAAAVGIAGQSEDRRNDWDKRAIQGEDRGQPGSCPRAACDAPGLDQTIGSAGEATESIDDDETAGSDQPNALDVNASEAAAEAHANGNGCDDVLFTEGEPPFGGHDTPVGPCNDEEEGADQETPVAGETVVSGANETAAKVHSNGTGCDDKLFGEGEPPFGGHDAPVGPCNAEGEDENGSPSTETTPASGTVKGKGGGRN